MKDFSLWFQEDVGLYKNSAAVTHRIQFDGQHVVSPAQDCLISFHKLDSK